MSWSIFILLILVYWSTGVFVTGIIFGDKFDVIVSMILAILWPIFFIAWILLAIMTCIYWFGTLIHDTLFNNKAY